jgi:glycosyltransferase involved in cell wall biosynthesis
LSQKQPAVRGTWQKSPEGLRRTVLHISTSDTIGGASRAMYSIHETLPEQGWTSLALVSRKASSDSGVLTFRTPTGRALSLASRFVDQQFLRVAASRATENVTFNLLGSPVARMAAGLNPSVVHLHWVGDSFTTPRGIGRLPDPTVWTLWDMWPFTGGCHYSWGCERHAESCGRCPIIGSDRSVDATRLEILRKRRAWRTKTFHVVAVSEWLAEQARRSSLFANSQIEIIFPGVDTSKFHPHEPALARKILGLPQDRPIIGFVALNLDSTRKGWNHLHEALGILRDQLTMNDALPPVVLRVGAVTRGDRSPEPVETIDLATLSDDLSLALAYSACSVVVVPSVQEAFPRVAIEALACGTPVVAFRGTGVADAVDHGRTGYLAELGSAADLARGLSTCLENAPKNGAMRNKAREMAVKLYSTTVQAARYAALYERLLSGTAAQSET